MTNQETIKNFADNFEATVDGFYTFDDVASGFFNRPAAIDEKGAITFSGTLASARQHTDFARWLTTEEIL